MFGLLWLATPSQLAQGQLLCCPDNYQWRDLPSRYGTTALVEWLLWLPPTVAEMGRLHGENGEAEGICQSLDTTIWPLATLCKE